MSCLPVVCFYLAKRAEDFPPPTDEVRRERDRERRPAARRASVVALERQRRDSLTLQPAHLARQRERERLQGLIQQRIQMHNN